MGCQDCLVDGAPRCSEWCGGTRRERAPDKQMECGLLWFTHISKTGGTSIQTMLQELAGANGWTFHDSLFLTFPNFDTDPPALLPERDFDPADTTFQSAPAWGSLVNDLNATTNPKPKLIVHHHDGMPGLSNPDLRAFLGRTRRDLRSRGCDLVMATALRSPVSRAVSDASFHTMASSADLTRTFTKQPPVAGQVS